VREFMLFVHTFSFALSALLALQAAFILPDETSQSQTALDAAICSNLARSTADQVLLSAYPFEPDEIQLLLQNDGAEWLASQQADL